MGGTTRFYEVNFKRVQNFEAGSLLLALIAFPDLTEDELGQAHKSLCWSLLYNFFLENPNEARKIHSIRPIHAFVNPKHVQEDLRTFHRRLRDRVNALGMILPFLDEVCLGKIAKFTPGMKKLTLEGVASDTADRIGKLDTGNIKTRIWRASFPAIHIISAIGWYLEMAKVPSEWDSFWGVFMNRTAIKKIIRRAEFYEGLIQKSPHLKHKANDLIRVRLNK